LDYNIAQLNAKSKQIDANLAEAQKENRSLQLAIKSQNALQRYEEQLIREKLSLLERGMVDRLRDLSRKEALVEAVQIDPTSFEVTLFRHNEAFGRSQLSAGEKQLLAIATMWALREISGLPMPVIVDTPLGRLDSDHRLSMVQNYFPRAGHQVILLATDAEIDEQLLLELEPAISHAFYLEFDATVGSTIVERKENIANISAASNGKVIQ
jgi:DNA sulfur modification protein DndD